MTKRLFLLPLLLALGFSACGGTREAGGDDNKSGGIDVETDVDASSSAGNTSSDVSSESSEEDSGDVGTNSNIDPDGKQEEEGCKGVDFLIVVDNSGSMGDEQQNLAASFPNFLATLQETLGDDADEFHLRMGIERVLELIEGERLAPTHLHHVDDGASAFHHVLHAGAEHAVDADEHLVAGLDEVDRAALHPGHAGAAHGKRQRVLRLEDLAEHRAGVVHEREVLRIEVPERGGAERAEHAVRDGAGTGTGQDALSRLGGRQCGGHENGRQGSGVERGRLTLVRQRTAANAIAGGR